jgi:hypothetical protein
MNWRLLNPGLIVAVLVSIFAATVLITAYSYSGMSGTFPQLVGWIFLGLTLLEVGVQIAAAARPGPSSDDQGGEKKSLSVVKEFKSFGWLGILLLALYLVGFMVSTPLYVFAFLRFSGQRSLVMSASIAAGATAFVYIVFIQLLEYKLFPGVLLMD